MGIPVMILGESGSGKTSSLRNLNPDKTIILQSIKKPLPFKSDFKRLSSDGGSLWHCTDWQRIKEAIPKFAQSGKDVIVFDDFQYMISQQWIASRNDSNKFQVYVDIAAHVTETITKVLEAPDHVRFYFLWHPETSEAGRVRPMSMGKMLSEKLNVEGLFGLVISALKEDGRHIFRTKGLDHEPIKAPFDMFSTDTMENDLLLVDAAITQYYELNQEA